MQRVLDIDWVLVKTERIEKWMAWEKRDAEDVETRKHSAFMLKNQASKVGGSACGRKEMNVDMNKTGYGFTNWDWECKESKLGETDVRVGLCFEDISQLILARI